MFHFVNLHLQQCLKQGITCIIALLLVSCNCHELHVRKKIDKLSEILEVALQMKYYLWQGSHIFLLVNTPMNCINKKGRNNYLRLQRFVL